MAIHTLLIDGCPYQIQSARVHKNHVITALDGIDNIEAAMALKGKVIHVQRAEIPLPDGQVLMADLIGMRAVDADTGAELGTLTDVLTPSRQKVYVIQGEREILVPAVDEFIREMNLEDGILRIHLIEGM